MNSAIPNTGTTGNQCRVRCRASVTAHRLAMRSSARAGHRCLPRRCAPRCATSRVARLATNGASTSAPALAAWARITTSAPSPPETRASHRGVRAAWESRCGRETMRTIVGAVAAAWRRRKSHAARRWRRKGPMAVAAARLRRGARRGLHNDAQNIIPVQHYSLFIMHK